MAQQMSLQLVRVKCGDETGGRPAERVGNDEIQLAAVGMDALGRTTLVPPTGVYAHFDDGEVKTFDPPKTLLQLSVPDDDAFPKTCGACLMLAEIDGGGFPDLAQKTHAQIKETIEARKREMANGNAFFAPIGPILAIIWEQVGPTVKERVKEMIAAGIADDVFLPQNISVDVTSRDFRWGDGTKLSPEATVEFRGHEGLYYLTYFWQVDTVA